MDLVAHIDALPLYKKVVILEYHTSQTANNSANFSRRIGTALTESGIIPNLMTRSEYRNIACNFRQYNAAQLRAYLTCHSASSEDRNSWLKVAVIYILQLYCEYNVIPTPLELVSDIDAFDNAFNRIAS